MRRLFLSIALLPILAACQQGEDSDAITLLNGTPANLDDVIRDRPTIINFWAASCAFCKDELPHFEEIHTNQPSLTVVGINLQEPQNIAEQYWVEGGYTFQSFLDPQSELKSRFDIFTRPVTIFLDRNGKQVLRKDGPITKEELEEYTNTLLEEMNSTEGMDLEKMKNERRSSFAHSSSISLHSSSRGGMFQPPKVTVEDMEGLEFSAVPSALAQWYEGVIPHLIPFDDILSGGPAKDGIRSIDSPAFLLAREVDYLDDDDIGILLNVHGNIRFYPYDILVWHEIVNDTVGGLPVAVTYCPLCATGVVYERIISRGAVEFGVSGFLYQSNLLMYDRNSDSLWNQVTGKAVVGPLTGERLVPVRSDIVRYKTVKENYIDALILSNDTGFFRSYGSDPYEGYQDRDSIMFPVRATDDRLPPKELVYGVVVDGVAKAFPLKDITERGTIQGYMGDHIPLRVEWHADTEEIIFTRYYTDQPGVSDEVIPLPVYWFSWVAQYPDTELLE